MTSVTAFGREQFDVQIQLLLAGLYWQYRQAKKSRIWAVNCSQPKVVTETVKDENSNLKMA